MGLMPYNSGVRLVEILLYIIVSFISLLVVVLSKTRLF